MGESDDSDTPPPCRTPGPAAAEGTEKGPVPAATEDAPAVSGARPAGTKAPRRTPRKKKKKGRPPRPEPGGEDAVGADEADRAPGAVAGVGHDTQTAPTAEAPSRPSGRLIPAIRSDDAPAPPPPTARPLPVVPTHGAAAAAAKASAPQRPTAPPVGVSPSSPATRPNGPRGGGGPIGTAAPPDPPARPRRTPQRPRPRQRTPPAPLPRRPDGVAEAPVTAPASSPALSGALPPTAARRRPLDAPVGHPRRLVLEALGSTEAAVAWSRPPGPLRPPPPGVRYALSLSADHGRTWRRLALTEHRRCRLCGLTPNSTYYVTVRAHVPDTVPAGAGVAPAARKQPIVPRGPSPIQRWEGIQIGLGGGRRWVLDTFGLETSLLPVFFCSFVFSKTYY